MIYTIGFREVYDKLFEEQENPRKLGQVTEDQYSGGWVWKTIEEAQLCCPSTYQVYGVKANWETDTVPGDDSNMPGMHYLLVTSDLVDLSNQD